MPFLYFGQNLVADLGRWFGQAMQDNASQCIQKSELRLVRRIQSTQFARKALDGRSQTILTIASVEFVFNGRADECRQRGVASLTEFFPNAIGKRLWQSNSRWSHANTFASS